MRGCPERREPRGGHAARRSFLVVLAGATLTTTPALGWNADPQVNTPVSTAAGHQTRVVAVADGLDGMLVAWEDLRTGDRDIYVQRLSVTGAALWTTEGVPVCSVPGWQGDPQLVSDEAGGAIVVWTDLRNGKHTDLFAQRIDAAGNPLWTAGGVPVCNATDAQLSPQLLADGAGGVIVAWTDHRGLVGADIYAQRLDQDGNAQWIANGVQVTITTGAQFEPLLAAGNTGGTIVVWQDLRTGDTSGYNIYAQHLDATGGATWTPEGAPVCALPTDPGSHAVSSDGAGGIIVVWQDLRGATSTGEDVFAQRLDAAGSAVWPVNGVPVSTGGGMQLRPQPVPDGQGGAIVVWDDYRVSIGPDVYAQRLDGAGNALWSANGIAVSALADRQAFAAVAADGAGGVLLAWHDYRAGPHSDLRAARVDGAGSTLWAAGGVAISTATGAQLYPGLTADSQSGALIAWQDTRNGALDVYAQRVAADGTLGGVVTSVGDETPSVLPLQLVLAPNPAHAGTLIRFVLPHHTEVSLVVVDAGGRRVRTLLDGPLPSGEHAARWDARNDAGREVASGVYFLRLETGNGHDTHGLDARLIVLR